MDRSSASINTTQPPQSCQFRCALILTRRSYFMGLRGCLCDAQRQLGLNVKQGKLRMYSRNNRSHFSAPVFFVDSQSKC